MRQSLGESLAMEPSAMRSDRSCELYNDLVTLDAASYEA